ncbi:MAG TPA: type IV toxin-antitoxin system AbiEi family antitoxin domain-containing protein [Solirubrobacterales bacterium]|nr:type IV toxin-antitoxin system AbiEi family antitoxin domain-containing protein [Solirubrobacterales bacterium]
MEGKVATPDLVKPDLALAEIARRQHGVISAAQLHGLGIDDRGIHARAAAGRLHRVHRGVYAVGHTALSFQGRCMAAVLAVGRGSMRAGDPPLTHWGAAISHRSAAALWELLPDAPETVDVIVSGNGGRARRAGVRVHRSRSLARRDVVARQGVPLTSSARTVEDLRRAVAAGWPGALMPRGLRKAVRQANVLGLPVDEESRRDRARGDLEEEFLRLCRGHRLPLPEVNVRVGAYLVDFMWHERRLVVETDHYIHHRGRAAFQDDRTRGLELTRHGYEVLQLSEKQIEEEAGQVAETLAAVLAGAPSPPLGSGIRTASSGPRGAR